MPSKRAMKREAKYKMQKAKTAHKNKPKSQKQQMSNPLKVIIDTDPGYDDIFALLFALAAQPEDAEVLLISVTFGNVHVKNCLRNVLSMFHVIAKELEWRKTQNHPAGFRILERSKPMIAVGADEPLKGSKEIADYFHGADGLAGISKTHPHFNSAKEWEHSFGSLGDREPGDEAVEGVRQEEDDDAYIFKPSTQPSHLEILRLLAANPPNTITIIAIGPLTNLALAASHDASTFLRVKELLVMGGAISVPGNITPLAEWNIYADPTAAAQIFALTSPHPLYTMPHFSQSPSHHPSSNPDTRRLNLTLFPLDITSQYSVSRAQLHELIHPLQERGSPLAEWCAVVVDASLATIEGIHPREDNRPMSLFLHDLVCIWYALPTRDTRVSAEESTWTFSELVDVRVEDEGRWTRGALVVDKRGAGKGNVEDGDALTMQEVGESPGDKGGWMDGRVGNRIRVCMAGPGNETFLKSMFGMIFI